MCMARPGDLERGEEGTEIWQAGVSTRALVAALSRSSPVDMAPWKTYYALGRGRGEGSSYARVAPPPPHGIRM